MKKKKIIIAASGYPNSEDIYNNGFVHTRAKAYLKDFDIAVLIISNEKRPEYIFEGITVKILKKEEGFSFISDYSPDYLLFHLIDSKLYYKFLKKNASIKSYIWIHGFDALGWHRRLFNFKVGKTLSFINYARLNVIQRYYLRKIIQLSNRESNPKFVFVSNWMKKITEYDNHISVKNYKIIPNPIDTELFKYNEKTPEDRRKILIIRPFLSSKYANDIAIEAILILSKRSFFKDLNFTIYGDGHLFDTLTSPLKKFKNISLHKKFIQNKDIPEVQKQHGVLLCPTRQDAQGVSMCEGMSSGLVPISSFNTAIPEFVDHRFSGILTSSAEEIADAIEELYSKPSYFKELSKNASHSIRQRTALNNVISAEVEYIQS